MHACHVFSLFNYCGIHLLHYNFISLNLLTKINKAIKPRHFILIFGHALKDALRDDEGNITACTYIQR